jgi:hypothetical protein
MSSLGCSHTAGHVAAKTLCTCCGTPAQYNCELLFQSGAINYCSREQIIQPKRTSLSCQNPKLEIFASSHQGNYILANKQED